MSDIGGNGHDDDDDAGKPVTQLDVNDPLNRALGAAQLTFNELYLRCQGFIDGALQLAERRRLVGFVDVKMTEDGDKLTVRRRLRAKDHPPAPGRWWHIPISPEMLKEFFERIKPAPTVDPKGLDVDAADVGEARPLQPVHVVVAEALRSRQRELQAFIENLKRTREELAAIAGQVDLDLVIDRAEFLAATLASRARGAELGETIQ